MRERDLTNLLSRLRILRYERGEAMRVWLYRYVLQPAGKTAPIVIIRLLSLVFATLLVLIDENSREQIEQYMSVFSL